MTLEYPVTVKTISCYIKSESDNGRMYKRPESLQTKWRMKMDTNSPATTNESRCTGKHLAKLTLVTALVFLGSTAINTNTAKANTSYLKSVAITDAAGANTPPTAVINYSKNGDVYTFDAAQSSDTDGSIVSYRWDFGDGTFGEGLRYDYTALQSSLLSAQLTTTDNAGGVTLAQIQLLDQAEILKDSFSESSEISLVNHAPEVGGTWHILDGTQPLVVSSLNYMMNTTATGGTLYYNDAPPSNADYTVSALVNINSTYYDRIAGPCLRVTAQGNGYCGYLKGNGEFVLAKHIDGSVYGTALAKEAGYTTLVKSNVIITINASGPTLEATLKDEQGNTLISLSGSDSSFQDKGFAGGVVRRKDSKIYSIEGM